eukprot:7518806-Pyramimonas_sp.AAC.2
MILPLYHRCATAVPPLCRRCTTAVPPLLALQRGLAHLLLRGTGVHCGTAKGPPGFEVLAPYAGAGGGSHLVKLVHDGAHLVGVFGVLVVHDLERLRGLLHHAVGVAAVRAHLHPLALLVQLLQQSRPLQHLRPRAAIKRSIVDPRRADSPSKEVVWPSGDAPRASTPTTDRKSRQGVRPMASGDALGPQP